MQTAYRYRYYTKLIINAITVYMLQMYQHTRHRVLAPFIAAEPTDSSIDNLTISSILFAASY